VKREAIAIVSLIVGSCAAILAGQPCVATTHAPQVYAAPLVYATAVQVLPAVFVPAPSYTVGLSHSGDGTGALDKILERLERMEAARPSAIADAGESAEVVLRTSCMRCHAIGASADRSGGYTFDPEKLTPGDRRQILDQVLRGAMPKGGPLTESRRTAVLHGLVK
jgi:mono/diheme cytochrome c family protein